MLLAAWARISPTSARAKQRQFACGAVAASKPPISADVAVMENTQARVINTCYESIKGLYASGDIIGLFFHNYPSCTGQTRNAVFSYLAGRGAGAMPAKN